MTAPFHGVSKGSIPLASILYFIAVNTKMIQKRPWTKKGLQFLKSILKIAKNPKTAFLPLFCKPLFRIWNYFFLETAKSAYLYRLSWRSAKMAARGQNLGSSSQKQRKTHPWFTHSDFFRFFRKWEQCVLPQPKKLAFGVCKIKALWKPTIFMACSLCKLVLGIRCFCATKEHEQT